MKEKVLSIKKKGVLLTEPRDKAALLAKKINGQNLLLPASNNDKNESYPLSARAYFNIWSKNWIVKINMKHKETLRNILTFRVTEKGIENFDIGVPASLQGEKICNALLSLLNDVFEENEKISMSILNNTTRQQMYKAFSVEDGQLFDINNPRKKVTDKDLSGIFAKTLMGHLIRKMGLFEIKFTNLAHTLSGVDAIKEAWRHHSEQEKKGSIIQMTKAFQINSIKQSVPNR